MWSLEKLQSFLLEKGTITDPDWLDNYFRPQLQKSYIQLILMSKDYYLK